MKKVESLRNQIKSHSKEIGAKLLFSMDHSKIISARQKLLQMSGQAASYKEKV